MDPTRPTVPDVRLDADRGRSSRLFVHFALTQVTATAAREREGNWFRFWCRPENAGKMGSESLVRPARGAIAQLGERVVRNDEAVGSIPTSSTIQKLVLSRVPANSQ